MKRSAAFILDYGSLRLARYRVTVGTCDTLEVVLGL